MLHPVSTRLPSLARGGVAAAIRDLAGLAPPGLVLEGPRGDAADLLSAVQASGRPVLAVIAPLTGAKDPATIDHPDIGAAEKALAALTGLIPMLARLPCRRLVIPVGD